MFAFLFDRRSGLQTGLLVAVLAILLFASGVLVGLNLRWSREEVTAGISHPLSLESLVEGAGPSAAVAGEKGAPQAEASGGGADATPESSPANEEAAPPEGWVPLAEGATPPGPSI